MYELLGLDPDNTRLPSPDGQDLRLTPAGAERESRRGRLAEIM
jgi:hypothetical protein